MNESALVSVIIVNWNGAQYLQACLTSLYQQTYAPLEIILVDNASTDNSPQVIKQLQSSLAGLRGQNPSEEDALASHMPLRRLQVIYNRKNEGFCRGNNQGIRHSQGEFTLLLNADVTLDSHFIETLVKLIQSGETIGMTLGKLSSGHDPTRLDSTGIVIYKNRRAVDRGQGETDSGQYDSQEEVFGASGAACLCRKAMLEDLKYDWNHEYLDELFFAYKEDVDLSWRARLYGWKCLYTPEARGRHLRGWGGGKRAAIPKWVRRHSLKNRYLMLIKNESRHTLFPSLGNIFWYELQSLVYILLREPYLFSVIGDILRFWPEIKRKRQITQQKSCQRISAADLLPWFQ